MRVCSRLALRFVPDFLFVFDAGHVWRFDCAFSPSCLVDSAFLPPNSSCTGKAKIGSASVAAPAAAPAAAGGAKPAAAAAKVEAKPEPEEEADLGFSLFD